MISNVSLFIVIADVVWLMVSLIGLLVYAQLRHRARRRAIDLVSFPSGLPIRLLADGHLRNTTLWAIASGVSAVASFYAILRDTQVLFVEIPSPGPSVVAIVWLIMTATIIGLFNSRDDAIVEDHIVKQRTSG